MINHLEALVKQYYEWKDYLVRNNVKVGRRSAGGWECELDIVAYHPKTGDLLHIEPSLDGDAWKRRDQRFGQKFAAGRKYIFKDVFPWLDSKTPLKQIAILISSGRATIAGGQIIHIDEFMREVRVEVAKWGIMAKHAIPEQFDLLRTVQLVTCGYYRVVTKPEEQQ